MNRTGKCYGCGKATTKDFCSNACIKSSRTNSNPFCAVCAPVRLRGRNVNVCKRCKDEEAAEREAALEGFDVERVAGNIGMDPGEARDYVLGPAAWHGPADEHGEWYGPGNRPPRARGPRVAVIGGVHRQGDTSSGLTRDTDGSKDEARLRRKRILHLWRVKQSRPYIDRNGRSRGMRRRFLEIPEIATEVGVSRQYVTKIVAGIERLSARKTVFKRAELNGEATRISVEIGNHSGNSLRKVQGEACPKFDPNAIEVDEDEHVETNDEDWQGDIPDPNAFVSDE